MPGSSLWASANSFESMRIVRRGCSVALANSGKTPLSPRVTRSFDFVAIFPAGETSASSPSPSSSSTTPGVSSGLASRKKSNFSRHGRASC